MALPYDKEELRVSPSGINYVVELPKLGAVISYNGLSFSIRLPYRLFGNNTKGQCGEPLSPQGSPRLLGPSRGAGGGARGWGWPGVNTSQQRAGSLALPLRAP